MNKTKISSSVEIEITMDNHCVETIIDRTYRDQVIKLGQDIRNHTSS